MEPQPETCPLCGKSDRMKKGKPVYGQKVCKRCYDAFTNRRQLAYVIDLVALWSLVLAAGFALGIVGSVMGASEEKLQAVAGPLGWAVVGLFLFKDSLAGHSPGKFLCGVMAIDTRTGAPIGVRASVLRTLPLLVPFFPFVVAFQLPKGHRSGDEWAHSKVIWKKYADLPLFAAEQGAAAPAPQPVG